MKIPVKITVFRDSSVCMNGIVDPGETCDDGIADFQGCKHDCSGPFTGWQCSPTSCSSICGDGLVVGLETCDDGS